MQMRSHIELLLCADNSCLVATIAATATDAAADDDDVRFVSVVGQSSTKVRPGFEVLHQFDWTRQKFMNN